MIEIKPPAKVDKKKSILWVLILLSPVFTILLLIAYAWINTSGRELWCKNIYSKNKEWMLAGNYYDYVCVNKIANKVTVYNKNSYPIIAHYYYEFPLEGELQQEADTIAIEHYSKEGIDLSPYSELSWKFFHKIDLSMGFGSMGNSNDALKDYLNTDGFNFYLDTSDDEICISYPRDEKQICKKAKDACQIKLILNGENVEENDLLWHLETVACNQEK